MGQGSRKKNFASVSPCLVCFYCRRLMDGMEIIRKWQKLCQPSCHQTGRGSVWHSDEAAASSSPSRCPPVARPPVSGAAGAKLPARISIKLKNEEH